MLAAARRHGSSMDMNALGESVCCVVWGLACCTCAVGWIEDVFAGHCGTRSCVALELVFWLRGCTCSPSNLIWWGEPIARYLSINLLGLSMRVCVCMRFRCARPRWRLLVAFGCCGDHVWRPALVPVYVRTCRACPCPCM